MKTIHHVADYFLRDAADHGQRIRHMKLQRLCYYAQGFHLAFFDGRLLFNEPFYAWQYGPVAPALSARFDSYGSRPIPPAAASAPQGLLRASDAEFLDLVVARLDGYHDWDLSHATQQEDPWINARQRMAEGGTGEIPAWELLEWFGPRAHQLSVREAPEPPSPARVQQVREWALREGILASGAGRAGNERAR